MTVDQMVIYHRLLDFSLDEIDACYPFSKKLAYENKWDITFAQTAIDEYKKFMFIAAVSDHYVSPPDVIDQVWHLHLTYTASYWNDFCPNVLGKLLHHYPSEGGMKENNKHYDGYFKTYQDYIIFFSQVPQKEFWPDPNYLLSDYKKYMRIKDKDFFLIEKEKLYMSAFIILYGVCAVIALLNGFLYIVIFFMISCFAAIEMERFFIKKKSPVFVDIGKDNFLNLDCYELAYLSEREMGVFNTVVTNLYLYGNLDCIPSSNELNLRVLEKGSAYELFPIERWLLNYINNLNDKKEYLNFFSESKRDASPIFKEYYNYINQIKNGLIEKKMIFCKDDSLMKRYPFYSLCSMVFIASILWASHGEMAIFWVIIFLLLMVWLICPKGNENTLYAEGYINQTKIRLAKQINVGDENFNKYLISKVAVFGISTLIGYEEFFNLGEELHAIQALSSKMSEGGGGCGG